MAVFQFAGSAKFARKSGGGCGPFGQREPETVIVSLGGKRFQECKPEMVMPAGELACPQEARRLPAGDWHRREKYEAGLWEADARKSGCEGGMGCSGSC